jgi:uncharacterized protein (TIGR02145 family)
LLLGAALREPGNIDAVTAADISPNSGSTAGGAIVKITGNFSPSPTTMQQMTRAYCASMAVYNGTNPGAVLSLSDTRNSQTYHVAKLADNNCWMLDDLKIADFKATAADTNLVSGGVSSNGFTIPGLDTTNTDDYNSPRVYGPVPGTGSGAANYGYLYNWNAATAGETTTSMPGDGTNKDVAPNSICPKSWRLPKGGSNDDVNNEFSQLNAKMAGLSSNQDSAYQNKYTSYYNNWQNGGLFKGVLSGYWVGSFLSQNTDAILWSSSAYPKVDYNAFYMYFNKSGAFPGSYGDRNKGVAIRCLATGGASTTPTITLDRKSVV